MKFLFLYLISLFLLSGCIEASVDDRATKEAEDKRQESVGDEDTTEGPAVGEASIEDPIVERPVADASPIAGVADVSLNWTTPSILEDGTNLSRIEISGYVLYWGASVTELTNQLHLEDKGAIKYVFEGMSSGRYYFAIAVETIYGDISALSNIAFKEIN